MQVKFNNHNKDEAVRKVAYPINITCIKCKVDKSIKDYYKNKKSKYGVLKTCMECFKVIKRLYHIEGGLHFGGNKNKALERDNYACVNCGMTNEEHITRWGRRITVDHIDGNGRNKISKEKNNDLSNLQTLCYICHGKKDGRVRWEKWRKEKAL